jgi:hypothetical protein
MKAVKRIFQVLAGLWLLAMITLGFGSAWLTNNPEVAADAAASAVGVDFADIASDGSTSRARMEAQERALDNGWGDEQALPRNADLESGGWAD